MSNTNCLDASCQQIAKHPLMPLKTLFEGRSRASFLAAVTQVTAPPTAAPSREPTKPISATSIGSVMRRKPTSRRARRKRPIGTDQLWLQLNKNVERIPGKCPHEADRGGITPQRCCKESNKIRAQRATATPCQQQRTLCNTRVIARRRAQAHVRSGAPSSRRDRTSFGSRGPRASRDTHRS